MLVRERVIQALEQQAGSFRGYQLAQHHDLDQCRQFLLEIAGWPMRSPACRRPALCRRRNMMRPPER